MYIVTARQMNVEDVEVGKRILIAHGVGYVPGAVTEVKTKERTDVTETHFKVKSETGFETGASFNVRGVPRSERFLVPDADVDPEQAIDAEVLDYIGYTVTYIGTAFFYPVPDADPEAVVARFRESIEEAGFEVYGRISARPVTEQKVVVYDGYGEDRRASAAVYEFASNTVKNGNSGVMTFDYLPVGA